jgi:hypothetical protein
MAKPLQPKLPGQSGSSSRPNKDDPKRPGETNYEPVEQSADAEIVEAQREDRRGKSSGSLNQDGEDTARLRALDADEFDEDDLDDDLEDDDLDDLDLDDDDEDNDELRAGEDIEFSEEDTQPLGQHTNRSKQISPRPRQ